jgi:hypothetical protein
MPTNYVNVVPTMTSPTAPEGVVTRTSDLGAGLEGFRAFDKNTNTYWHSGATSIPYLQYQFVLPKKIVRYAITSRSDAADNEWYPVAWTFLGSDNGTTYIILDTRTAQTFTLGERKEYDITVPATCAYYKLAVTSCHPSSSYIAIKELELFEIRPYSVTPKRRTRDMAVVQTLATPNMTSETAPSGTITKSSEYNSSWAAWKAFDGDPSTYWHSNNGLPQYIQYQFATAILVTKYGFSVRLDDRSWMPHDWTFSGSNNGVNYTTLDTKTNQYFTLGEERTFTFTNTTLYSYYKLNVTDVMPSSNYAVIRELKIYATRKNYLQMGRKRMNMGGVSTQNMLA